MASELDERALQAAAWALSMANVYNGYDAKTRAQIARSQLHFWEHKARLVLTAYQSALDQTPAAEEPAEETISMFEEADDR